MPTSAEEEAEGRKNEREAVAAEQTDQHQAVIASILPNGMVKEQMQAQAERPDANKTQELKDYERRQEADAELKSRYAKATENNPPHPTIQHSKLIAADNAKAVAENIKTEQHQKEEAARQEAARTAEHDKAETAKAEQIKASERAKEEPRKESDKSQQRTAGAPSAFAQRRAEYDTQHAQTQEQQRQQEADVSARRFAERRAVVPERYQPLREQSDFRQRQEQRAAERPAREATEARTSLANNADGKQKDREGSER